MDLMPLVAERALAVNYSPHTGKRVCAAVRTKYGYVHAGTNIEGRAGTTIHAEKAAVVRAIFGDNRKPDNDLITEVYINGAYPCGACLHFLSQFTEGDCPVRIEGDHKVWTMRELLPLVY